MRYRFCFRFRSCRVDDEELPNFPTKRLEMSNPWSYRESCDRTYLEWSFLWTAVRRLYLLPSVRSIV
jgi:hypothetical protein